MRATTAERLACPLCYGAFRWEEVERQGDEIVNANAPCPACGTRAVIRNGIGYFRPGDAPDRPPSPGSGTGAASEREQRLWKWVLDRASPLLGSAFERAEGPWLEVALPGAPPGILRSLRPEWGIVASPEDMIMTDGSPGGAVRPDQIVVEVHSLPFRDRAVSVGLVGPGLLEARGARVILREVRRVTDHQKAAILLTPQGEGSDPEGALGADDDAHLLGEFEKARWSVRVEELGIVSSPDQDPSAPGPSWALRLVIGS